jgi:hypothetical protein
MHIPIEISGVLRLRLSVVRCSSAFCPNKSLTALTCSDRIPPYTRVTIEFSPLASCLDLTVVFLFLLASIFAAPKHKAAEIRGRPKNTKSHAGAVTGSRDSTTDRRSQAEPESVRHSRFDPTPKIDVPRFGVNEIAYKSSRYRGTLWKILSVLAGQLRFVQPCFPLCDVQSHRRHPEADRAFPGQTREQDVGI